MPIQITMPRLSDTMEEGTLVKWRVKVGDKVSSGDVLADVETDKATMELPTYDDGTVAKLAVRENQSTKVGALILVLAAPGESVEEAAGAGGGAAAGGAVGAKEGKGKTSSPPAAQGGKASSATGQAESDEHEPPETPPPPPESAESAAPAGRIRVSPLARKIAESQGVDLATLKGSGPDGRIVKRDVLAATAGPGSAARGETGSAGAGSPAQRSTSAGRTSGGGGGKLEAKILPLSNMRKTIARRLVESKTTIPHFTVTVTTEVGELMRVRAAVNKRLEIEGIKLSVNDFIIRAAALAVLEHPLVNASWTDAGIQLHGTVNLGVAVSLPAERGGGLVVPVIRDAQNKDLRTISAEARAMADKARTKGLAPEDMAGGTLTISNLGMLGVDHFEAIINPPQAAILAIGAAAEQPVVVKGRVAVGWRMSLTLSADHRVVDGSLAAQYVNSVKDMLETPAALLI